MRYPTLRYGNPEEMRFYAQGVPMKDLARRLRRSERSVRDWLTGKKKVPWWVPELLRLQHQEHLERHRQMGFTRSSHRLGVVQAEVIAFPARPEPLELVLDAPAADLDPYTLPLFSTG